MAIIKIEIKDFTVFKDISIDFSKRINVFIGENGTGKTHLLKLLYAFFETGNKPLKENEPRRQEDVIGYILSGMMDKIFGYSTIKNNQPSILNFETSGKNFEIILREIFGGQASQITSKSELYCKNKENSIFIPAKDMLTHAKGLLEMANKYSKDMPFDKTLLDIIEKSKQWKLDEIPDIAINIIPKIEKIINGIVLIENNTFYIQKENGQKIEFAVEAEGLKKFGLLWQLLMNGNITKDTALLWDEPEANINPKLIPDLVEILLELSRNGVQIFIATQDYFFAKYLNTLAKKEDDILFHGFDKDESQSVNVKSVNDFSLLENNSLIEASVRLYKEELRRIANGNED